MAEVNAFSIDGTKYQFTATDQTYVGETGLAQLGLDSTCTPDEAAQALAEAGGGTLLLSGHDDIDPDTWDTADYYGGGYGLLRLSSSATLGNAGTFCRTVLEFDAGRTDRGRRVKRPVYSSSTGYSFEGADWTVLVYGTGDTWSTGVRVTCIGRAGSASSDHVEVSVPLCAPVAPGVSSATCTSAGTVHVCWSDTSTDLVTHSTSHVSVQGVGNGCIYLHITDVSDLGTFDAYNTAYVSFSSDTTFKFS